MSSRKNSFNYSCQERLCCCVGAETDNYKFYNIEAQIYKECKHTNRGPCNQCIFPGKAFRPINPYFRVERNLQKI